jgi:hypothetical protein
MEDHMGEKFEYLWTIASNLILLAITFIVFNKVSTPFEVFVVAGILIIYVEIGGQMTDLQRRDNATLSMSNSFILYVVELLKDPDYDAFKDQIENLDTLMKKSDAHYYINSASRLTVLVVATYHIIISLIG